MITVALASALTLTLAAAGVVPAGAPQPAAPELAASVPPVIPFALALDLETVWRLDQGYRLLGSARTADRSGVTLSYDVTRVGAGTFALALGYHGESQAGTWAGGNDAALSVKSWSASAILRWGVTTWLESQLRIAGDLSSGELTLRAGASALDDSVRSLGASAGAGLRLRSGTARIVALPGNGLFALAGLIEGGFHAGQPLSFAALPAGGAAPDDRLPAPAVPLGHLGRSYPYLRLSVALVF
jgi:hypothetical protein